MEIDIRRQGEIVIVDLAGEVDLYNSPRVRERFNALIKDKEKNILVSLVGVTYMDSSGLATLIEALQKITKYGGKLKLAGLKDSVKSLFEIARLENIFSIYGSEEEALASY